MQDCALEEGRDKLPRTENALKAAQRRPCGWSQSFYKLYYNIVYSYDV